MEPGSNGRGRDRPSWMNPIGKPKGTIRLWLAQAVAESEAAALWTVPRFELGEGCPDWDSTRAARNGPRLLEDHLAALGGSSGGMPLSIGGRHFGDVEAPMVAAPCVGKAEVPGSRRAQGL